MKKYRQNKIDNKINILDNTEKEKFKKFSLFLKEKKGYLSYERINKLLKSKGNPCDLKPTEYIILKFLIAFIFFGCFSIGSLYLQGLLAAVLGFFLIDILNNLSDKKQMKYIRFELSDVCDFINIQNSAGVFLGTALSETYLIVKNKRFKKALTELAAEINITKNIDKSLENFASKFSSVEIDGFVMVMKQSLVTGKSRQALDDMSDSLKDTNMIIVETNTNKIKTTKVIIQLLMYIGVLSIVLYGMYVEIGSTWTTMFK